jgi:hypothetical protein
MSLLCGLRAALHELIWPEPWPPPERDETTPQVIAEWIASRRHPPECAGGCRCDAKEVTE